VGTQAVSCITTAFTCLIKFIETNQAILAPAPFIYSSLVCMLPHCRHVGLHELKVL